MQELSIISYFIFLKYFGLIIAVAVITPLVQLITRLVGGKGKTVRYFEASVGLFVGLAIPLTLFVIAGVKVSLDQSQNWYLAILILTSFIAPISLYISLRKLSDIDQKSALFTVIGFVLIGVTFFMS